ncbi:hypothetical protein JCM5353_007390 [Sporobolomyces roseus]
MSLPTTSKRPLYIFAVLLLLIVALISSLKASGHPTRFLKLSSLSTSHPVNSSLWSMTPPHFPSPKSATIVILVNPGSNHYQVLIPTLQNLEEKFNRRLGYPIQLLTDGQLPDEKVRNRTEWITGGKARWSLVTAEQGWGPPSWIIQDIIDTSIKNMGFNIGYRNMCRFFSMWHWKHPAVREFEYVWRLDDTSRFHCSLMEDPIAIMERESASYGFSQTVPEAPWVIPTLWQTTLDFIRDSKAREKGWIKEGEEENWLDLISDDGGKTYNLSFEIVHRSFFDSEPYQAYVDYLDKAGGFYSERWGDAPIRTIATALFLPRRAFHDFSPITGYQHGNPPYFCPDKDWCDCQS